MEVNITPLDEEFEYLSRKTDILKKKLGRNHVGKKENLNLEKEIARIDQRIAKILKKIKN